VFSRLRCFCSRCSIREVIGGQIYANFEHEIRCSLFLRCGLALKALALSIFSVNTSPQSPTMAPRALVGYTLVYEPIKLPEIICFNDAFFFTNVSFSFFDLLLYTQHECVARHLRWNEIFDDDWFITHILETVRVLKWFYKSVNI